MNPHSWPKTLKPQTLAKTFLILLAAAPLASGCKKFFSKAEMKAFRAETSDSWEYLMEKTASFDGVPASGFAQSGLMPNVQSGTGSVLAQSLDSIGVCYWYVKVPKQGPQDRGYMLDFEDGTPNIGVRNNLIARAGVPFTTRALRLTDVLMAMSDAGGELKQVERGIVTAAVQAHEMLWNAAEAGGISAAALTTMSPSLLAQYAQLVRDAQSRFLGSGHALVSSIPATPFATTGSNLKVRHRILPFGDVALQKAKDTIEGYRQTVPRWDSWWKIIEYTDPTTKQIQQIAFDESRYLIRTTAAGDAKNLARYGWKMTNQTELITKTGIDAKALDPATQLTGKMSNLKKLGLAVTRVERKVGNISKTAAGSVYDAGRALVRRCTGAPWRTAVCSAVVGSVVAGSHMILANSNQAKTKLNEEQINQKIASFLSNPNLQQNFGAILQDLTKQTNISTELMDVLRTQLKLKSEKSPLPGCNQAFGTELLLTTGVMDQGYGLPNLPMSSNSGYASNSSSSGEPFPSGSPDYSSSLASLPTTPDSSLAGIPSFGSEASDLGDFDSTSTAASGPTLPSADPIVIPSDSQHSDLSSSSGYTDSETTQSGFGSGTSSPTTSSSGDSPSQTLQSDPFGPTP